MKTINIIIDEQGGLNISDTVLGMTGEHNNTKLVISSPEGFFDGADYFRMSFGVWETADLLPVDGVIEYLIPSAVTDSTFKSWQMTGFQLNDSGLSAIKKTKVAIFTLKPSVDPVIQNANSLAESIETEIARLKVLVNTAKETVTYMQTEVNTANSRFVDKIAGKGLSANDYTNTDKAKVDSIQNDISTSVENKADKTQVDLWSQSNTSYVSLIAEDSANKAMASSGVIPFTPNNYFSITASGELSLAPAYRGAIGSTVPEQWSDRGKGVAGSLFASLPEVINIPANINTITVKSLATYSFAYSSVKKVYMPNTVETLGGQVFAMSKSLERCYLSENLISAGEQIFHTCTALDRVVIPEKLTSLPKSFFYNCAALTSVIIGRSVESLGQWAIRGTGIKEITLPEKLTSIGQAAFWQCYNLETVNIKGVGLQSIAQTAFGYCTALKQLNILSESGLKIIGQYAIEDCTSLEKIVLPEGLESIEKGVFWECNALKSVNIPSGLKYLYSEVFNNLPLLSVELKFPEGLLWIGDFAFNHCAAITNRKLTIPASVKQLGGSSYTGLNGEQSTHLFYNCGTNTLEEYEVSPGSDSYCTNNDGVLYNKDKTVLIAYPPMKPDATYTLPDSVMKMSELCFSRNRLLKTLILSDNYIITTELPGNFLNNANSLAVAIYLQTNIENVECHESNPHYKSVNGMVLSKDGTILYYIPKNNSGTGVIRIPEGVTTVYRGALYGTEYTASALHIPASLVTIDADTFSYFNDNDWTLTIAENNPAYTVNSSGKLAVKGS